MAPYWDALQSCSSSLRDRDWFIGLLRPREPFSVHSSAATTFPSTRICVWDWAWDIYWPSGLAKGAGARIADTRDANHHIQVARPVALPPPLLRLHRRQHGKLPLLPRLDHLPDSRAGWHTEF